MADYYSLLARAVGNLPDSNPVTRRAIYERARAALLGQLRGLDPPAPEADIGRESTALDSAIARLEIEIDSKAQPLNIGVPVPAPQPVSFTPAPATEPAVQPRAPIPRISPVPAPPKAEADAGQGMGAISAEPRARPRAAPPRLAKQSDGTSARRNWRVWGMGGLVALVVVGVATAAYILPNPPFDLARSKPVATPARLPDAKPGKIGGRIGGGPAADAAAPKAIPNPATTAADQGGTAAAPVAVNPPVPTTPPPVTTAPVAVLPPDANPPLPVAQRAALLVQTGDDVKNVAAFVGTVVWRIDTSSSGTGQALQSSVRADVDIPEARFKAVIVLQNNIDATLPASHTITIRFQPAADSQVGNIKAIDVPELREDGAQSGVRLIGTSVAIKENNFLAALARGDQIIPRNLELLRNRAWVDFPMQLANNRLAKLTMEKGPSGDRVISDAMAAWEK